METTVFIDTLDTATLQCPTCNRKKTLQLSQYNILKPRTRIKYRCGCGEIFMAVLEHQRTNIRDMQFLGTCTSREEERWSGRMTVKRINAMGLTLMLNMKHKVAQGHRLVLEFVLDDAKQSIVKKKVVVTAAQGLYVSARFSSQEHFDNLGPYLFFNKLLG